MENFYSILFETAEKEIPGQSCPDFFVDLNLDQIIDIVLEDIDNKEIASYFYTPLSDIETVKYRQGVMKALENSWIRSRIESFMVSYKNILRALHGSTHSRNPHQKSKWLVDSASMYCSGLRALSAALSEKSIPEVATLISKSKALSILSSYLEWYLKSPEFIALESDTENILSLFEAIHYQIHFDEGKVILTFEENDEKDIVLSFRDALSTLTESDFDYKLSFFPGVELTSLERQFVNIMRKRYPDYFLQLSEIANKHEHYQNPLIEKLYHEFTFYLAYLKFTDKYTDGNIRFICPEVVEEKELRLVGAYDLALASKTENPDKTIVTNDFYLEGKERVFILTGPNQGGKTTFARSFGQIMYLARLGCTVPCTYARLWLCHNIHTHFATEEDLSSHSGRLQEELIRLGGILEDTDDKTLLIFNELFATTTTYDAVRLGGRVLERIQEVDAICLYVSHITDLCEMHRQSVSLVAEVKSRDNPERTYKIVRKKADGEAYAASLAKRFGLLRGDILTRKGANT